MARMEKMRNAYRILVGKPSGNVHVCISRFKYNVKQSIIRRALKLAQPYSTLMPGNGSLLAYRTSYFRSITRKLHASLKCGISAFRVPKDGELLPSYM
jgi:hypothetical protein